MTEGRRSDALPPSAEGVVIVSEEDCVPSLFANLTVCGELPKAFPDEYSGQLVFDSETTSGRVLAAARWGGLDRRLRLKMDRKDIHHSRKLMRHSYDK
jgi:hypothetical protein